MSAIDKLSLAAVSGVIALLTCVPTNASAPDISGTYTCQGSDPLASNPGFAERLVLTKNNETYSMKITRMNDVIPYDYGTAIMNKDVDNAFAYVYWNVKDPTSFGSELMSIKKDGSLDGVFSDSNRNKPGVETCTKAS